MENISLRDIIETLFRGKWLIAAVTVICMVISIISSFFIIERKYEAQTMLMISPVSTDEVNTSDVNGIKKLVGALSEYPQMSVDTYREQIKAPVILDYIRDEMQFKDSDLNDIANKISVNAVKNTNLITVTVKDAIPSNAAKIANLVSNKFTSFVSETNQKQAESSAAFIKKQMENEKTNLDKALIELKNFISQPRGPEELRQELDSKLKQLTEFKTEISQIEVEESSTRSALTRGKDILSKTPQTLKTNKTLLSDAILADVIKDKTGAETSDIAGLKLTDEQINGIYTSLSTKVDELDVHLSALVAKKQSMESEIANRQKEIEVLQSELAEKQQKFDILNHDVELIKQAYDAYQQKYKEAMIKQSADIGKSSIVVISEAVVPDIPVEPNKKLNLMIATVFGLMFGAFVTFALEYWNNSKPVKVNL